MLWFEISDRVLGFILPIRILGLIPLLNAQGIDTQPNLSLVRIIDVIH